MNEKFPRLLGLGIVAAAAVVVLAPTVAAAAKPFARRGLKAAVKAYARGREAVAELQEVAEDAYAEAWAELKEEEREGEQEEKAQATKGARGKRKRPSGDEGERQ